MFRASIRVPAGTAPGAYPMVLNVAVGATTWPLVLLTVPGHSKRRSRGAAVAATGRPLDLDALSRASALTHGTPGARGRFASPRCAPSPPLAGSRAPGGAPFALPPPKLNPSG